jgi:hypothetical protein
VEGILKERMRTDNRRTRSHMHKRVKCPVWKNVHERSVKHFQYVPRTGKSSPFSLLLFFSIFSVSSCFYSTRRWNDSYRKWNGLMGRTFKGFESRRRGVYHVACLSMKCYFKVRPTSSSSLPALPRPWTLLPNAPHGPLNPSPKCTSCLCQRRRYGGSD